MAVSSSLIKPGKYFVEINADELKQLCSIAKFRDSARSITLNRVIEQGLVELYGECVPAEKPVAAGG